MDITINKKNRIEYNNLFFCFAIILNSVVSLFCNSIRLVVSNTYKLDTFAVYFVFIFVLLKAIGYLNGKFSQKELIMIFLSMCVFAISFLSDECNESVSLSVLTNIIKDCVVVYLGVKMVRFTPKLLKYLRWSALIVFLKLIANVFVFEISEVGEGYSQYDGYVALTGMALQFIPLVKQHRWYDYLLSLGLFLASLFAGARGPLLFCGILFVVAVFLIFSKKKYAILAITFIIVIVCLIFINLDVILKFLLDNMGDVLSARVIERLLNDTLLEDSARTKLWNVSFNYILEHPLIGTGVVNDRIVLNKLIPGLGEIIGSYTHNFFLEIMMQFGLIIGVFIALALLCAIVKNYLTVRKSDDKLIFIALFCVGFFPLMVSSSYLDFSMFYAFVGFMFRRPPSIKTRSIRSEEFIC